MTTSARDTIQLTYRDVFGKTKKASPDALAAVRKCLERESSDTAHEPVIVAWEGKIREPDPTRWTLLLEGGETRSGPTWPPKERIPFGYHRLVRGKGSSFLISAPSRAYSPQTEGKKKFWGLFAPLYALHTKESWGCGDYSTLAEQAEWLAGQGGEIVSTLPLLPIFFEKPFDPSPYNPVTRRFWSEFFVDVPALPEFRFSKQAAHLYRSEQFQRDLKRVRRSPLVPYEKIILLKRQILEDLADTFFQRPTSRLEEFYRHLKENPSLEEYSRFRAAREGRKGRSETYYLYTQWVAREQLRSLSRGIRARSQKLYLDFPVGVHRHGYDAWKEPKLFVGDMEVGAPPDLLFREGQNWGFAPLHPGLLRRQGYRYLIECIHHHMELADILRIDHVMGLHRLFWIPKGFPSSQGVYVHYRPEELYAILCLESHRHQTWIVGENLGTVPPYVNRAMSAYGLQKSYIAPWQVTRSRKWKPRRPPADSLASLNTHDTPTFAAFWKKEKPKIRKEILSFFRLKGRVTVRHVLRAWLGYLASSPARFLLINLEDLWLEKESQNVPGPRKRKSNWRRKAAYRLGDLRHVSGIQELLRSIDRGRKSGR